MVLPMSYQEFQVDGVRIADTAVGKGLFATKDFPTDSVIGEITGQLIEDPNYGSEYCLWLGDNWHLEPDAPFRFLNHHCEANCDWDCFVESDSPDDGVELNVGEEPVYVFATRDIRYGEELTLDYSWSADVAIPCRCGAESCRGWIVCPTELGVLRARLGIV